MHDLRRFLFYLTIAYSFLLPGIFVFLLLFCKILSHFLIPLIIIDTILFVILLGTLFWLRGKRERSWLYILLISVILLVTIRNLYLFIAIIYRTMTDFEKKRTIFSDAIHRQINLLQEPKHPIWQIIVFKQCCGLDSKTTTTKDYQWFEQTPFAHFCRDLHLKQDQINQFESAFKMKYSPQGLCIPLVNNDLKIELILISIGFGFGILLVLLAWLYIWQERLTYFGLVKNILQESKKKSIIQSDRSSTTSTIQEPEVPHIPAHEKSNQIVETKQLYKGYLTPLEDMK